MSYKQVWLNENMQVVLPKREYLFLVNTVNVHIAEIMRRKNYQRIIDCDLFGTVKEYQTKKTQGKKNESFENTKSKI